VPNVVATISRTDALTQIWAIHVLQEFSPNFRPGISKEDNQERV
jgi:hypothetical protein